MTLTGGTADHHSGRRGVPGQGTARLRGSVTQEGGAGQASLAYGGRSLGGTNRHSQTTQTTWPAVKATSTASR